MSHGVRIENVIKDYGDFRAINGVDLTIEEGELFTLLGPSGCGKTTLLRMIAGFNTIEDGKIYIGDTCINNIPAHKRNIGMVFQNYAVFPHMSVKKNVAYGLEARKVPKAEIEARTMEALRMMKIEDLADRQPSQLSGGQQQRVALARAIVIRPGLLLMDEPLSNLDAKLRVEMRSVIRKLQQEVGITTIYVTHDQEEAMAISSRIAVMNAGKVEQVGKPSEIYITPANRFVANFIGTSNFLKGKAEDGMIEILGCTKLPAKLKDDYTGEILISVRPQQIRLEESKEGALNGVIQTTTFLGDHIEYDIQVDGMDQNVLATKPIVQAERFFEAGDHVSLNFAVDHMNIYDPDGRCPLL